MEKNRYVPFDHPKVREHLHRRIFAEPIPAVDIHPDYTVRTLREDEIQSRGLAAWKTTQADDPDTKIKLDMPEAKLTLDIINHYGKSIFPKCGLSFTNSYHNDKFKFPNSGIYTIQVSPLPDTKWWWGWYSIKVQ